MRHDSWSSACVLDVADQRVGARLDNCVQLAPHVHGCWTQQHVVLLDLKRNKYLGIPAADALALDQLVQGWPARDRHASVQIADFSDGQDVLQEMLEDGMLTTAGHVDQRRTTGVPQPVEPLIDGYSDVTASVTLRSVMRFLRGTTAARMLLSRSTLERIAQRVQRRRAKFEGITDSVRPFDVERTRMLTATFTKLRMFFFTANNECLFDSLALAEFLAHYRVFPHWVFGVSSSPFAAHCWLQHDGIVINDSPELVAKFAPIMIL